MFCENCKKEIKEKKEKKIEIEGTDNAGLTLFLLAGAGVGGYLLWKKLKTPETVAKTPSMESDLKTVQPTTEENKNMIRNMIRVD